MKHIRIIPKLDIKGPNLIKGIHLEGLRVLGDPHDFAEKYYKEGMKEVAVYADGIGPWMNQLVTGVGELSFWLLETLPILTIFG